jgi:hypothetical protein
MLTMGLTIPRICARPLMPHERTVWTWVATPGHPFYQHYARARESYYQRMADDIIEIADNSGSDWKLEVRGKDKPAVKVVDREVMERSRLRIETRKWLLSKALPAIYGDQADKKGAPAEAIDVTPGREEPRALSDDHLSHLGQRYLVHRKTPPQAPVTIEGKASRH